MTAPNLPLTMPSKPQERGAATTISQRDRRFTDTFFDTYRHPRFPNGRPFTGQREFQSGSATESIAAGFLQSDLQCAEYFCENPALGQTPQERALTIASAWEAPWLPAAKYWRYNYRHKRVTFALDQMIADERAGLNRYWEAAAKLAGENDDFGPDRPLGVPFRIRTLLGMPTVYTGKITLAQAAQAGDPWLMGAVPEPNERLAKILGHTVQYLGAPLNHGDAEYVAAPAAAAAAPVVTPDQVLSVAPSDLAKMIADAIAAHEQAKKDERAAKMRAGKKGKTGVAA